MTHCAPERRELSLVRLSGQIGRSLTPHVTPADDRRDLPAPIELAPIAWPVDRLILHGEAGSGEYETLGSGRSRDSNQSSVTT